MATDEVAIFVFIKLIKSFCLKSIVFYLKSN